MLRVVYNRVKSHTRLIYANRLTKILEPCKFGFLSLPRITWRLSTSLKDPLNRPHRTALTHKTQQKDALYLSFKEKNNFHCKFPGLSVMEQARVFTPNLFGIHSASNLFSARLLVPAGNRCRYALKHLLEEERFSPDRKNPYLLSQSGWWNLFVFKSPANSSNVTSIASRLVYAIQATNLTCDMIHEVAKDCNYSSGHNYWTTSLHLLSLDRRTRNSSPERGFLSLAIFAQVLYNELVHNIRIIRVESKEWDSATTCYADRLSRVASPYYTRFQNTVS